MKTYVIAIGVVKFNNKVLLLKRSDEMKLSSGQWEFVSGMFDTRETGETLILREVKEEAGLEGKIEKTGEVFIYPEENIRWVVVPYLVRVTDIKVSISSEHVKYRWVYKKDIKKFDKENGDDFLQQGLSRLT